MENDGLRRSKRIKEISVRFISDSDVHNIIKPLSLDSVGGERVKKESKIYDCDKSKDRKRTKRLETQNSGKDSNFIKKKEKNLIEDPNTENNEDDSEIECLESFEKPTSLFEENDVSGSQMFGFQTPKRKGAMAIKASLSSSKTTPSGKVNDSQNVKSKVKKNDEKSLTPVFVRLEKLDLSAVKRTTKTPYSLRTKIKKRISNEKLRITYGSESDCSDINFSPDSESESDSSKSISERSSSSEDEKIEPVTPRRSARQSEPLSTNKRKRKDLNYVFTSDAYFESQASKIKTSDHTLSRLHNPKLTQDVMHSLLNKIPHSHEASVQTLINDHMSRFNSWKFLLSQGFNIILYGLGSKRSLLHSFHKEMLSNSLVVVVNGFFPSLTIKEVIDNIAIELLGLKHIPPQPLAAVAWVESKLMSSKKRVFLIVHNLDGPMLRSEKAQTIFSRLACIQKLHLICSIDHINCPLLWDHNKLSKFNFIWEDVTSFLSYNEETSFETSLMVQKSGSLALASLSNVFRSLTRNAREIFKLLLEDHLSNKSNQKYIGISLSELYRQSRDSMLVTSDLALRTQLTEFLDHQLVKWRRDSDHLYIPIENTILIQFQKELEEL
uniref:Origin recognition complex subunit 2 n=1 Tax=Clastoptera arizonana TaxID=38151 RepID=A0A1B6D3J5_9HEMI